MVRLLLLILLPLTLFAEPIPRRILAFWDSRTDKIVEDSLVHKTLEMPLNYLGLDVIYHDIQEPLPTLSQQDGIRGVLVCFDDETLMKEPEKFIKWMIQSMDLGKKVVLMGNLGFTTDIKGKFTSGDLQNRLFEKLGFKNTQEWIDYPNDYEVLKSDSELLGFEKNIPHILSPFYQTLVYDNGAKSYLTIGVKGQPETNADVAILSPNGGYIANGYANYFDRIGSMNNPRSFGWYVNPFRFFQLAFDVTGLPVPDTTTLAGRRIFIATCHGDDFNTGTMLEELKNKDVFCSEVLLEKVIKPNPDIPTAVAFIAADFDPKWAMKGQSHAILNEYVTLPQVEAASHSYSHPFDWDFFRTGGPEKEIDYLALYPYGSWQNSFLSWIRAKAYQVSSPREFAEKLKWGYAKPRAYANEPFNVEKEITGAVDYLNTLAPKDNQIKLIVWPGDSRPWDVPALMAKKAGIKNFGGGFVQFDAEYPSNLFVYPLARKPGGVIQLYASANAENAYTYGWRDRFYGYQYLPQTLINTDQPRRLKPIELYYHSYSGQFRSSVNAILSNINFIRSQSPIALQVGRFIDMGEGFFTVAIESLSDKSWKIKNRQGLQTIRFDALNDQIDLSKSIGVIGYREHENSLYVYLDASVEEPVVTLNESQKEKVPYLVESSWELWGLERKEGQLHFSTKGWGKLFMRWNMGRDGTYRISSPSFEDLEIQTDKGTLALELELPYNKKNEITIQVQ